MRRRLGLVCAALALAGCGLGAGEEREAGAELRITRDFGHEVLAEASEDRVREDQTVMRFLQSERNVETRYGGQFVQSIDGLSGSGPVGREDWFYFVNGIEADVGAGDFELSPHDVVQWDHRDWRAAMRIPAIVGAFPEPFLHGYRGKRLPVRVECEDEDSPACGEVKSRLRDAGVPATGAAIGVAGGGREELLRVLVAKWERARDVRAAASMEEGPEESGVFARFTDDGLELLDERGERAREAPPGTGLVAMTGIEEDALVLVVTGIDDAGVEAAAQALDRETLRDAFAVAVTPDGPLKLPVIEERSR
jgi:hypothetical protein